METTKSTLESPEISRRMLVSFVRELFNSGYPDPEGEPQPPGPWDPVIRAALKRMASLHPSHFHPKPPRPNWVAQLYTTVEGPSPEPWNQIGEMSDPLVALSPQAMPPVFLFAAGVANEMISDALSRQEMLDLIGIEDGERSTQRISRFFDDFCGTVPRLKFRWPFPGPPPPWWRMELSGAQLIAIGVQFENAAGTAFNEGLRKAFTGSGIEFIGAGLARMDKMEDAAIM